MDFMLMPGAKNAYQVAQKQDLGSAPTFLTQYRVESYDENYIVTSSLMMRHEYLTSKFI